MERKVLRGFLFLGLGLLPLLFRKEKTKDWLIIFLLQGFLASFLDSFVTKQNKVDYPVRFLPKYFRINILFDYFLFPVACVFYNQITYYSKPLGIIMKSLMVSGGMTVIEVFLERKTRLIRFKKGWTWYYTFLSEALIFILTRMFFRRSEKME